jgi:Pyridine nucleotide-disulphide oxidoreductase, dimerisation domain/Pyridine nucleotide-disulphide oxidoreductase/Bacterial transcriptional activator domain/Transcriptional regulatory protein, C terminal
MRVGVLGPLEVREGDHRLQIMSARQRAPVALLALDAGQVVSADRLIDGVSGDEAPADALNALQHHVSRLRRTVGPSLVTRGSGYLLELEPEDVDALWFARLAGEGRAALRQGNLSEVAATLRGALALWRSAPLEEFLDRDWARQGASRLQELYLDAVEDRITVLTATLVERLDPAPAGVAVQYRSGVEPARLEAAAVFFAVGWPGNADTLGADAVGSTTTRGYVKVGKDLRSSLPHVFAAGDVNGTSMLVPSARPEGHVAAENAVLGTRRPVTHEIVPTGSFTDPEYGSVGLTEAHARERYDCAVAVVRYDDLVRPVADAHPERFCKLIVERHRRFILGAHVVGDYSAEVIQMAAAYMAANLRRTVGRAPAGLSRLHRGGRHGRAERRAAVGVAAWRRPGVSCGPPGRRPMASDRVLW